MTPGFETKPARGGHGRCVSAEFLAVLIVVVPDDLNVVDIATAVSIVSEDSRPQWWTTVPAASYGQLLPGPYLLPKGRLRKVHRIYDDVNQAFVVATKPRVASEYAMLSVFSTASSYISDCDVKRNGFSAISTSVVTSIPPLSRCAISHPSTE